MGEQFRRAEDEFIRLKGQLTLGRITQAQFDAALRNLMVQDDQSRLWTLHADTGKWLLFDGQTWHEADPNSPVATAHPLPPPPSTLPELGAAPSGRPAFSPPPSFAPLSSPLPTGLPSPVPYPPPPPIRPRAVGWIALVAGILVSLVVLAVALAIALSQGAVQIALGQTQTPTIARVTTSTPTIAVTAIPVVAIPQTSTPSATNTLVPTNTPPPTATYTPPPTSTPQPSATATRTRTPTFTPTPTQVLVPGDVLFQDSLATNQNGWLVSSTDQDFFLQDGKLHVVLSSPGGRVFDNPGSAESQTGPTATDFVLEADISLVDGPDGNAYGIAFRKKSDAYYSFELSGKGAFRFRRSEGKFVTLIDWTPHPAVRPGKATNAIRIVAQGTMFRFYVNNTPVATYNDQELSTGDFGPIVVQEDRSGGVHAAYDNLQVWKYVAPASPGAEYAKGTVIFQDDFSDNRAEWRQGHVVTKFYFQDNTYHVYFLKPGGSWQTSASFGAHTEYKDFVLQADVTHIEGSASSSSGINFRSSPDGFYQFGIYPDGTYQVSLYAKGIWKPVISQRRDPVIKPGDATNTLKVIAKGSSFQFFINGAWVGAAEEKTFAEGELALYLGIGKEGLGHAGFRSLTVWQVIAVP